MIGNLGSDHAFGGRQGAWLGPPVKWAFRPLGGGRADLDDDGDEALTSPAGRHSWEAEIDAGWLSAIGSTRGEAASQGRIAVELERRF